VVGIHGKQAIVGYFPTYESLSTVRYELLSQINYAFLLPRTNGGLSPIDGPGNLVTLVSTGHAQGLKVYISVGGGGTPPSTFEAICANSSTLTTFVNNLIGFVDQYGLDGVDIDWEYPPTPPSTNYATFMIKLATALHNKGKMLSTATVGAAWAGDGIPNSVFPYLDFMHVMAYDDSPTNVAPYSYAVSSLAYWTGRGFPANRLTLGVPFYGYAGSWQSSYSFAQIVQLGGNPSADSFTKGGTTYTYNGITTIQQKAKLVIADALAGIMIWEIGQDASGSNSLLTAINAVLAPARNETATLY